MICKEDKHVVDETLHMKYMCKIYKIAQIDL